MRKCNCKQTHKFTSTRRSIRSSPTIRSQQMSTNSISVSSDQCLQQSPIDVSIIIPVYNGEQWLDECLQSVIAQKFSGSLELSIFNDGSTDKTSEILAKYRDEACCSRIRWTIGNGSAAVGPGGVGFAKNRAVQQSSGRFLCFLDADDVMLDDRIQLQFQAALFCEDQLCLIGSRFIRDPKESTVRYSRWANELSSQQLYYQAYTSHGPTVIAPTWFTSRKLYDAVDGFRDQPRKGFPEDLDFFYRALSVGAKLIKVDRELMVYRYHQTSASFSVSEETIWNLRVHEFQKNILNKWAEFTIWNAGKQGKKFFKSLTDENKKKVIAFCDVDVKKVAQKFYELYDSDSRTVTEGIPIVSYRCAQPPAVICVKLDMTDGVLEGYLNDLCWSEGIHYFHMS